MPDNESQEEFWTLWNASNIDQRVSSKIQRVFDLVNHYSDVNAQPLFFLRDGSRDHAREAECKYPPAKRSRKILVFVMYEVQRTILKRVSTAILVAAHGC